MFSSGLRTPCLKGSQCQGKRGSKKPHAAGRTSIDAAPSGTCLKRDSSVLVDKCTDWKAIFQCYTTPSSPGSCVRRPCISVVGLTLLGSRLADCLASKAGSLQVGVHDSNEQQLQKYTLLPGVEELETVDDVCTWSDVIVVCLSYKEGDRFLSTPGIRQQLKGKCVLQLACGTPADAQKTASLVKSLGATYLDAYLLSDEKTALGRRGASLMVSGDLSAWEVVKEDLIDTAFPSSVYIGFKPEWAKAVNVARYSFLAAVHMGMQQALAIAGGFNLPRQLLPDVISRSDMPLIRGIVRNRGAARQAAPQKAQQHTTALLGSPFPSESHSGATSNRSPASTATSSPTVFGSLAWFSQLEHIRELCVHNDTPHDVIDSLLAAGSAHGGGPSTSTAAAVCGTSEANTSRAASPAEESPLQSGMAALRRSIDRATGSLLDTFGSLLDSPVEGDEGELLDMSIIRDFIDNDALCV